MFGKSGNLIRIVRNRVIETGPRDRNGASAFRVDETDSLIFEGESRVAAIAALREIPIGVSVTVRHPAGLRSCMNKPGLWDAIAEY